MKMAFFFLIVFLVKEISLVNYLVEPMGRTCTDRLRRLFVERNGGQLLFCIDTEPEAPRRLGKTGNPVVGSIGLKGLSQELPLSITKRTQTKKEVRRRRRRSSRISKIIFLK